MSEKQTIKDFILKNFLFSNNGVLADEESLVRNGIIDSTGVLEVISFLEETFNIKVADEEMIPENLDSVSSMVAFVARKKAA
jgi:acyl carrier protein